MTRFFPIAAAICLAAPSFADVMPATEVSANNAFVAGLDGRIRTIYQAVSQPFLFELQDRDVANLFSYGMPPSDRTLGGADVAVLMVASWQESYDTWNGMGLADLAFEAQQLIGTNAMSNISEITAPDGHSMLIYTFMPNSLSPPIPDRCFARMVIDDVYRQDYTSAPFNLEACAEALR